MNVMNVPFIRCLQKIHGSTPQHPWRLTFLSQHRASSFALRPPGAWAPPSQCLGDRGRCVFFKRNITPNWQGFLMSCLFILDFSVYIQIVWEDWLSCQLNNNWLLIVYIQKISSERGIALKSSKNLLTLNVQNKIRYNLYGCFQKWWVSPTNPWVFLLKMIILRCFAGYHHLRRHPYIMACVFTSSFKHLHVITADPSWKSKNCGGISPPTRNEQQIMTWHRQSPWFLSSLRITAPPTLPPSWVPPDSNPRPEDIHSLMPEMPGRGWTGFFCNVGSQKDDLQEINYTILLYFLLQVLYFFTIFALCLNRFPPSPVASPPSVDTAAGPGFWSRAGSEVSAVGWQGSESALVIINGPPK